MSEANDAGRLHATVAGRNVKINLWFPAGMFTLIKRPSWGKIGSGLPSSEAAIP